MAFQSLGSYRRRQWAAVCLDAARSSWVEVQAHDDGRDQSIGLPLMHRLRAADITQIAAAIIASGFFAALLDFVTLDIRQADAAEREGFLVFS